MDELTKLNNTLPNGTQNLKMKLVNFKDNRLKKGTSTTIIIVLMLIMAAVSVYFLIGIVGTGTEALRNSYNAAYTSEKNAAYQVQYEKFFDRAERNYHVSNRVAISIGDLVEIAKLEVLKVSDVEYIIEEGANNSNGITSWLEVPGQGIYVVNLQAAEFIVNDELAYVKVRVPYPELENISIDYANVKKLFFKNDILNDSYKVGEELAQRQLKSADILIKKEFESNQYFYISAQDAAVSTIQCLVRQLNPQNTDMDVEVEFY